MEILTEGQYFGNNVKTGDHGVFECCLTEYQDNNMIDHHYHTNAYLSILINGGYWEHNTNETINVKAGDILFRPQYYSHQNTFNSKHNTCFNVEFKTDWEHQIGVKLKLPKGYVRYTPSQIPSLYKLLIAFKFDFNGDLTSELMYDWLFVINQKTLNDSKLPCVESASKIVESELCKYHSLSKLAERVHVHPVYLARAFKKKKGITLGEYQLRKKLTNAVSMLLNSSATISCISFANGFYDDAHFIRSFKAFYNISPHQFRLHIKS